MKVSVKIAPFSNKARIVVDGKVYAGTEAEIVFGLFVFCGGERDGIRF